MYICKRAFSIIYKFFDKHSMWQKMLFIKIQTLSHKWHLRYTGNTRSSTYDNSRRAYTATHFNDLSAGVPTERTKLCSNRSDAHLSASCEFRACECRRGLLEKCTSTLLRHREVHLIGNAEREILESRAIAKGKPIERSEEVETARHSRAR